MFVGIVVVCILAVVAYLVLLPLVQRGPAEPYKSYVDVDIPDFAVPDVEKEAVLSTINEIEFDFKMNKLSQDDYDRLKSEYRQMALEMLKQEDESGLAVESGHLMPKTLSDHDVEAEIERELASLRKQREMENRR